MTLPPEEHADDLGWHALNYRTAATQHAEAMWQELQACVDRKVKAEREACAQACQDAWEIDGPMTADEFAALVRARGE